MYSEPVNKNKPTKIVIIIIIIMYHNPSYEIHYGMVCDYYCLFDPDQAACDVHMNMFIYTICMYMSCQCFDAKRLHVVNVTTLKSCVVVKS